MLINLLPHRTQPLPPARRRWQRECLAAGGLSLLLGVSGFFWQQEAAQSQRAQLQAERAAQAGLRQQHTILTQEVSQLSARVQQLQALQGMNTQALSVLLLWVPALPPGVVVQSLRQEPGLGSTAAPFAASNATNTASNTASTLVLQGVAPPDDSVAQWLQHLPASIHGELLELRSTSWPHGAGRWPVQHFTVRLQSAAGS